MSCRRRPAGLNGALPVVELMEPRRLLCSDHLRAGLSAEHEPASLSAAQASASVSLRINFQPESAATVPPGYRTDIGRPFGLRANGMSYGWSAGNEPWIVARNAHADERLDTVGHFGERHWEIAVPNGSYSVTISAGDPSFFNSRYRIDAEGVRMFNFTPTSGSRFVQGTQIVNVTDGRLTITSAAGASNNKINFIEVSSHGDPVQPPPGQLVWNTGGALPLARVEAQQAVYNGKLYVFGGYFSSDWHMTSRADVYDPATNTWKRIADLPGPLSHAATVGDGKNILLIGGYQHEYRALTTRQVWKYDTRKDAYEALPPLPAPRGAGAAAILGTNLHFFGGQIRDDRSRYVSNSADHWVLDLRNIEAGWQVKRSLPNARNHLGGVSINGRVFAIGGQNSDDEYASNLADVHVYNPHTDRWWQGASLPVATGHINASTFTAGGHVFVVGGAVNVPNKANETDAIWRYDVASNAWSKLGSMPGKRKSLTANVVNGELIAAGGGFPGATSSTFRSQLWVEAIGHAAARVGPAELLDEV